MLARLEAEPELARLDRAVDRIALLIVRSSASDWLLWMDLWVYSRRHPEAAAAQHRFARRWRAAFAEIIGYVMGLKNGLAGRRM